MSYGEIYLKTLSGRSEAEIRKSKLENRSSAGDADTNPCFRRKLELRGDFFVVSHAPRPR